MSRTKKLKPRAVAIKPELMWAVHEKGLGFYVGTGLTRSGMIEHHLSSMGLNSWRQARDKNQRVIRVLLVPIENQQSLIEEATHVFLKQPFGTSSTDRMCAALRSLGLPLPTKKGKTK